MPEGNEWHVVSLHDLKSKEQKHSIDREIYDSMHTSSIYLRLVGLLHVNVRLCCLRCHHKGSSQRPQTAKLCRCSSKDLDQGLSQTFTSCCVNAGSDKYFDDKEGGGPPGTEGEMYPYVSFSISIDS